VGNADISARSLLEYYLYDVVADNFNYDEVRNFTDKLIKLSDFGDLVSHILDLWVEHHLRDPYFDKSPNFGGYGNMKKAYSLKPDKNHSEIPEDYFKFACYIAIANLKYGPSHASVNADRIFWFVEQLGSDLPTRLKKHGSGDLPKEVTQYKDAVVSCNANDALATIRITLKDEAQSHYGKVLDFLLLLLADEFPKSYLIDFRSADKNFLAIKGLPKKGVNRLFANAVRYPDLHGKIEQYARLVMREDEWYNNLDPCAMTGTFAVFALGLLGEQYAPLVMDYLDVCDGEHQELHGNFVSAYVEKFGFTQTALQMYDLCEGNIQEMPPRLVALRKKVCGGNEDE
jgi:hypothetical protein